MAGCNSENTARQAPLQRNNDEGVFCHDADCLSHASWLNGDEVAKNEKNTSTTDEKHIVDTATQSAFINEKTDSLLEASPVIKPPAIKIPP